MSETKPAEFNYAKTRMAQLKLEKEQMDRRITADELSFKRDCRRTALQLSERIRGEKVSRSSTLPGQVNKTEIANDITKDVDVLYKWLIDVK